MKESEQMRSEKERRLRFFHGHWEEVLSTASNWMTLIAAILSMTGAVAASLKLFLRLKSIPSVYLALISVVVGLAIIFVSGLFLYRRRLAQKQAEVRHLKQIEAKLFQSIEADLAHFLSG